VHPGEVGCDECRERRRHQLVDADERDRLPGCPAVDLRGEAEQEQHRQERDHQAQDADDDRRDRLGAELQLPADRLRERLPPDSDVLGT